MHKVVLKDILADKSTPWSSEDTRILGDLYNCSGEIFRMSEWAQEGNLGTIRFVARLEDDSFLFGQSDTGKYNRAGVMLHLAEDTYIGSLGTPNHALEKILVVRGLVSAMPDVQVDDIFCGFGYINEIAVSTSNSIETAKDETIPLPDSSLFAETDALIRVKQLGRHSYHLGAAVLNDWLPSILEKRSGS
ncbi:MAG: hypothetical protein ACXWLH_02865 [Candidatus Saccharimonadales bacterium]